MSLDSILRATGKNLLPNPNVHAYNYSSDYKKYNNTDEIFLAAGTYSVSVSANCPTLQFWNVTTKQQYTVDEAVSAYSTNTYYKVYEGYALGRASDAVRQMWFTLKINALITLNSANTSATSQECQIEKGSTATTYEPYEYLGPKTINLGSGSSSKEVLKVSYNSKNFFNINNIYNPLNTDTYEISNNALKVYRNRSYIVGVIYHISLPVGTQYTLYYDIEYGGTATGVYNCADDKIFQGRLNHVNYTGTIGDTGYLKLEFSRIGGNNDKLGWVTYSNIQLELGNKKTEYVPYFNTVVWTQVLTGYNITSTINADGTQSLNIVDATSTTDHYNITSTDNSDGTQTLNITDA